MGSSHFDCLTGRQERIFVCGKCCSERLVDEDGLAAFYGLLELGEVLAAINAFKQNAIDEDKSRIMIEIIENNDLIKSSGKKQFLT